MGTECSYDYVFVYDGDSFDAPLLGSFSGKTDPQNVTASSGYVSFKIHIFVLLGVVSISVLKAKHLIFALNYLLRHILI